MDKVALIMAGGSGTRFWPLSTNDKPKQFLDLVSEKTMIKETVDRIKEIIPAEKIFISTNIKYFDIIKKELPEIADRNIIFEPMARDTAACIGYAACIIRKIYKNSNLRFVRLKRIRLLRLGLSQLMLKLDMDISSILIEKIKKMIAKRMELKKNLNRIK